MQKGSYAKPGVTLIVFYNKEWIDSNSNTLMIYRVVGNFDRGNFDYFDAFQPDRQNLTHQILKAIQCLVKDTDHPSKYFLSNI